MADTERHPDEPSALNSEQWRRLRDLFGDAQEMPESERAAFLDRELAGEPALRAELDSFLASAETAGAFLAPREPGSARAAVSASSPATGSFVGPYRLVELLGEGGFGVVYLAEQEKPIRRRVALKLIKPGMDTRQVIARFDAERQALAVMDHPSIAQVFAAGETEAGRPYFAMEYVPGVPITEYCDARRASVPQRLELFVKVCLAVQHAHQKGVIHRDIKPTNVLVTEQDGAAVPKVIDFGVARAATGADTAVLGRTSAGTLVGTFEHMSPEQAAPGAADVDTRSDVYALGVLLYELLAGGRPFQLTGREIGSLAELQRRILEVPPLPPSLALRAWDRGEVARRRGSSPRALGRSLTGDLDWIVLRALEKDPARRYASASEMAADVQRFLRAEPVLAGPPSLAYRLRRFLVRHRAGAAAAVLVAAVATIGWTLSLRERRIAAERLADYRNLADRLLLEDYRRRAASLWPLWPETVPAMERWTREATALASRADFHAGRLRALRERAQLESAVHEAAGGRLADLLAVRASLRRAPGDRDFLDAKLRQAEDQIAALRADTGRLQRFVFASPEDQRLHDHLAALVEDLQKLADPDPDVGLIAEIQRRRVRAVAIERATLVEAAPAWARAIASISDPRDCPRYAGLRITPQVGLVPLGRDPASGLWEFLVWGTGGSPRRGRTGWVVAPETGMVLVLLPGGVFTMGTSTDGDPVAWRNEGPKHEVTLDPFFLSKYEMTRGQWRRMAASEPSLQTPPRALTEAERGRRDIEPVDQVYWQESHDVLARLGLTLPTEAQWEYAARGGTTTPWYTGAYPVFLRGHANLRDEAARRADGRRGFGVYETWLHDGYAGLAPVGSFRPNPFGLHDVIGNVSEWCRDWFQVYECPVRPSTGERIPVDAGPMRRMVRGGNRGTGAAGARVTSRTHVNPATAEAGAGLRPSRPL